jgi:hypothetical protein
MDEPNPLSSTSEYLVEFEPESSDTSFSSSD